MQRAKQQRQLSNKDKLKRQNKKKIINARIVGLHTNTKFCVLPHEIVRLQSDCSILFTSQTAHEFCTRTPTLSNPPSVVQS